MNKKLSVLILTGMLLISMIGCKNAELDSVSENTTQQMDDETKDEQKQQLVEIAYYLTENKVDEIFYGKDYSYKMEKDGLVLTNYFQHDEISNAIYTDKWDNLCDSLKETSSTLKEYLNDKGYTNVNFTIQICDAKDREETCYLIIKDGEIVFNIADNMN
jgi:hypothetical protein|nr:MAG TPA: hypothetical protein [Caudoviricetes sp.]